MPGFALSAGLVMLPVPGVVYVIAPRPAAMTSSWIQLGSLPPRLAIMTSNCSAGANPFVGEVPIPSRLGVDTG